MPTVYSILEKSAKEFPEKAALAYNGKSYSYAELNQAVEKVKGFFLDNTEKQDIVALYMENCDAWVISYFGILGAGCICNPLGLRASDKNLQCQMEFAKPKFVLASSKFVDKCKRLGLDKEAKLISFEEVLAHEGKGKREPGLDEECFNSLMYTSGTKGMQKAIRLRHRTVYNATCNIVEYLKPKADTVYYQILPLTHSFGLGNVHVTFMVGGKVVIAGNTINYRKILNEIVEHKANFFAAVPLTISMIVENFLDEFKKADEWLRILCTNTGPMPIHITKKLLGETKNVQFYTYYGLTEASRSSFMHFNAEPGKLGSVGKPSPNARIKLVDEKGQEIEGLDAIGQVAISGNHVVEEYWRNGEATKKAFREGWLFTGDMAYFDKEGFLYIIGRDDDIVNIAGEKVSLQEIDNAIEQLPFVGDCACLEEKDERTEYRIKAFVVLNKEKAQDEEEARKKIVEHCRECLDNFKVPESIVFVEEIPKTDSGKTRRGVFRRDEGENNGQ